MLDVTVDRQVFTHLRALTPKTHQSVLSPLTAPPTPDRKVAAKLRAAGLIGKNGAPTPDSQDAAAVLTRASSVAEVEIAGQRVFDYAVYRPGRGQPVSVMTVVDGLRIQQPAAPGAVVEMIGETLGRSRIAALPFEVGLPVTDALVLAALMDAERAARLTWLGGGAALEPLATLAELAQALTSPTVVHALVTAVQRVVPAIQLSTGELTSSLGRLATSGLAEQCSDRWTAAGDAAELGGSLLVVEKYVTLRAASLAHDGSLTMTGVTAAFSGAHGVLTVETDGELVQLRSVAPYDVVSLAAGLLVDGLESSTTRPRESAGTAP
ncbi:MAG: hypothetical protein Q7J48_04205 [Nocardioides sp.]|nr:hypothetical protein [Nocardioides sp.]